MTTVDVPAIVVTEHDAAVMGTPVLVVTWVANRIVDYDYFIVDASLPEEGARTTMGIHRMYLEGVPEDEAVRSLCARFDIEQELAKAVYESLWRIHYTIRRATATE